MSCFFLQVDCLSKEKDGLTEKLQESRSSLTLLLEENRALQQQTNVGGGGEGWIVTASNLTLLFPLGGIVGAIMMA